MWLNFVYPPRTTAKRPQALAESAQPKKRARKAVAPTTQVGAHATTNPLFRLDPTRITAEDLVAGHCRQTLDKKCFAIHDAIAMFKGCSKDTARSIWKRMQRVQSGDLPCNIKKSRVTGANNCATPVATLPEIVQILQLLTDKHPGALIAQVVLEPPTAEQVVLEPPTAEQVVLAGSSTKQGVNTAITTSKPLVPAASNPLFRLDIMQLTEDDLCRYCRFTPDRKRFSIYDAIAKFKGCSIDRAGYVFRNLDRGSMTNNEPVEHKFPGAGQRPTPVGTLHEIVQILARLPGKQARALNAQTAEVTLNVLAGSRAAIDAAEQKRAEVSPEARDRLLTGLPQSMEIEEAAEPPDTTISMTTGELRCFAESVFPEAKVLPGQVQMLLNDKNMTPVELVEVYSKLMRLQHEMASATAEQQRRNQVTSAEQQRLDADAAAKRQREADAAQQELATAKLVDAQRVELARAKVDTERARAEAVKLPEENLARLRLLEEKAQPAAKRRRDESPCLSGPDLVKLFDATFGAELTAKCAHPGPVPCAHVISVGKCWVVADQGYSSSAPDVLARARVVCPEHGEQAERQPEQTPIAYVNEVDSKRLQLWLFRAGYKSRTQCKVCVQEELCLWHLNVECCHILSHSDGGNSAVTNLVLGSQHCNKRQGAMSLSKYHARIGAKPTPNEEVVPQGMLKEARKELTSLKKDGWLVDAVQRARDAVGRLMRADNEQKKQTTLGFGSKT